MEPSGPSDHVRESLKANDKYLEGLRGKVAATDAKVAAAKSAELCARREKQFYNRENDFLQKGFGHAYDAGEGVAHQKELDENIRHFDAAKVKQEAAERTVREAVDAQKKKVNEILTLPAHEQAVIATGHSSLLNLRQDYKPVISVNVHVAIDQGMKFVQGKIAASLGNFTVRPVEDVDPKGRIATTTRSRLPRPGTRPSRLRIP